MDPSKLSAENGGSGSGPGIKKMTKAGPGPGSKK